MWRPSGETIGPSSGPRRSVSCVAVPSATETSNTSVSATNTLSVSPPRGSRDMTRPAPSGVHEKCVPPIPFPAQWPSPLVIRRAVPPSDGTTKTWTNPCGRSPNWSKRYTSRSTTCAGSAHCAPSGGVGIPPIVGAGVGTNFPNAICVPSGDHANDRGGSVTFVITEVSPESIQRTWICALPLRFEMKASRVPSGDQRGELSLKSPVVRGRCPDPSEPTIQRFEKRLSVMMSARWRT